MKVLLVILSFVMGTQAFAAAPTTAQFINRFVQTVNDRLEKTNLDRAMKGGRLYCAQLSDEQVSDIESLFVTNPTGKANQIVYRDLEKITVGQFIAAAADQLSCYPTFWPSKGRSSIGAVLFNSKSFVMDHLLLQESMKDLIGRTPEDSESLAKAFRI